MKGNQDDLVSKSAIALNSKFPESVWWILFKSAGFRLLNLKIDSAFDGKAHRHSLSLSSLCFSCTSFNGESTRKEFDFIREESGLTVP